jgi:predicted kinase
LPSSAYDQAATDRVYAKLFELAQGALAAGASVVLDAVFAREPERAAVSAMARTAGAGFTGLWLEAAPDVLEKRLAHRTGDVSDADAAVLRRQLSYDLGAIDWYRLDAGQSEADVARNALAAIEAP